MTSIFLFGIIHFIAGYACAAMIREIFKTRREIKQIQKNLKN